MINHLIELFEDQNFIDKIRIRLPYLFNIAELESSRAGKIGMEVGSVREKILIALLIYKFGESNVETKIPITESEVDVLLFGYPISIKTITGINNVKVIWTVDAHSALKFFNEYQPKCDILLALLKWDLSEKVLNKGTHPGGIFMIPLDVQMDVLSKLGREKYLNLPKAGTNPRGVEISKEGLSLLLQNKRTKCVEIYWKHVPIDYDPLKRWVDYWKE